MFRFTFSCYTFIFLTTTISISITSAVELSTLQLVQIIARHGDRAPIRPYPNDMYTNATLYSPNGWGELSEIGAKQVYELGAYFRKRYDGFLPRKYFKRDFLMLSSDVDRAIMSAEANLAGLYELGPIPRSRDIFKEWQPVPIHTIPEEDDNLIEGVAYCPKYNTLLQQFYDSEEFNNLKGENDNLVEFVVEKSGVQINTSFNEIFQVQDALRCQHLHNLTLPSWVNSTVYDRLQHLKSLSFIWKVATDEMKRLKVGPLLERLVGEMRAKVEAATLILDNEQDARPYQDPIALRKMYIYSGHDSTISGVLHTLNLFQPHIPPYAAALVIELHKKPGTEEFFIELFYRNDTSTELYMLDTSGFCGMPCSFESFSLYLRKFIPADWKQECQLQTYSSPPVLKANSGFWSDGSSTTNFVSPFDPHHESERASSTIMHPLGITAPGLLGFVLAVIAVTSLLVSTILLSSFLREKNRVPQFPMNSYHHLS